MNLEEGFRRIGAATIGAEAILGIIFFAVGQFVLGIPIAVAVIFVGFCLLYIVAYVISGFTKQTDEGKDRN